MYTGKLNVLRDSILYNLTILCNTVELYLVGLSHELGDNYGVLLAHLTCLGKEALKLLIVVTYVHGSTREDIRGTNEYGIAYLVDELLNVVHAGECAPTGLIDTKLIKHGTEFATVLGTVNADGVGAKYGNCLTEELHGKVVGYLTTYADNNATGALQVDNIENALEAQLVEVETVAHIIVGRHGLGVVVNHYALVAQLACSLDSINRTPVELNTGTNTISA
jgi:hypothetical protein